MQLRFLAVAGPDEATRRQPHEPLAADGVPLEPVLRARGLAVWAVQGTPCVADSDGSAVAIGLLFDRADGRLLKHLPCPLPPESEFVAHYWGAYVLLASAGAGGHLVLRDPSGAVTVYHRRSGVLDFYASDAALMTAVADRRPEPNSEFLRQWLTFPLLRSGLTGVRGWRELVPGSSRRHCNGAGLISPVWSPCDHVRRDRALATVDEAATVLRGTLLGTVPRLAGVGGDIVVQLSGGLDSSIVAASLTHAGCAFRAVTFVTRTPDGDERVHARAVARHCGIELTELIEEPSVPDFDTIPPLAPRPQPNALLQPLHDVFANHLALTGADLTLSGAGGDNVFCYLANASPVLDAFHLARPRAGVAALRDVARLHGTTFWAAARAAYRRSRLACSPWPRDERFLAPDAPAQHAPEHPWLETTRGVARGKLEHVRSILGIHHFLADPAPGAIAALHPLLAQPILEACLRIPSWLWIRGGRDRAIARAAFRGLLPDSILARRSKGNLGSLFMTGYMASRPRLEALLLEGRMARSGLLDREAIRAYLRREQQPADGGYLRLLDLASAETWLRSFDR